MALTPEKTHALAAEMHDHAARAHRSAARLCGEGDSTQALELSASAATQARVAAELSQTAHVHQQGTVTGTRFRG